jgi:hypothetical protein
MKRLIQLFCLIFLVATSAVAKPKPEKIKPHPAQGIPDEYIVVLQEGTPPEDWRRLLGK